MVMIMANICNGEMRVLGSLESKKKLLDLFLRETVEKCPLMRTKYLMQ